MKKLIVCALMLLSFAVSSETWRTPSMGPANAEWKSDKDDMGWYISACVPDNNGKTVCAMASRTDIMIPGRNGVKIPGKMAFMYMLSHDYDVKSKSCKMMVTDSHGSNTIGSAIAEGSIVGYGMDAMEMVKRVTPDARAFSSMVQSLDVKITVTCPDDDVKFTIKLKMDESAQLKIGDEYINKVDG